MAHPYPPHLPDFPYVGKFHYFLTFSTNDRRSAFTDADAVDLVRAQILRAAAEQHFAVCAYCFMPDHLHIVVSGLEEGADCRAFIKAAKQYSGFHFKRQYDQQLWQRYGFERMIRDDLELALTIGYVVANPVRAGLVLEPADYPHLGSTCYSVAELLEICEYSRRE